MRWEERRSKILPWGTSPFSGSSQPVCHGRRSPQGAGIALNRGLGASGGGDAVGPEKATPASGRSRRPGSGQIPVSGAGASGAGARGHLAGRRGRVLGTRSLPLGRIVVTAQAPLAELDDYPERLKALTGGTATYTLELAEYEPVPESIQQELCRAFKRSGEED